MDRTRNQFVQRQLARIHELECELVGLYAEACYSGIQAAYGNRSCMERAAQLDDTLHETERRLTGVKACLRRLGVPPAQLGQLDYGQRLALFEAAMRRHNAAFAPGGGSIDGQLLNAMLEDFVDRDIGER